MEEQRIIVVPPERMIAVKRFSARGLVAPVFRHRKLVIICFVGILLGAVAAAIFMPKYSAEMEILAERGRVDPGVISADENFKPVVTADISEEELNSEAEMLQSDDILAKVVIATGLDQKEHGILSKLTPEEKIAKAVRRLDSALDVETVKKTNIIKATYKNSDPQLAQRVLATLSAFYMEKHAAVHRPPGQVEFFDKQIAIASKELNEAEAKLAEFSKRGGVVAPTGQKDLVLQKMNEFAFNAQQARASAAETKERLKALQQLSTTVPERVTTALRQSDNPMLLQQMKTTLLNLELKRSQLLAVYQPSYRPVQEVEREIADTRAAITKEESRPLSDRTTDQNSTHQWVRSEIAKAEADLKTFNARATASDEIVARYRTLVQEIENSSIEEQDLLRNAKTSQDNYLLYVRKREEARISNALDQSRILNVSMAETPTVPALPAHPVWVYGLLGAIVAFLFGAGLLFAAEYTDSTFRTPDEITTYLNVPVIAAIPAPSETAMRRRSNETVLRAAR